MLLVRKYCSKRSTCSLPYLDGWRVISSRDRN